ncbi:hypothetical protein CR513_27609, partial [Mucuna pruriens]
MDRKLLLSHNKLSRLNEVNVLEDDNDFEEVTDNMLISLRKGNNWVQPMKEDMKDIVDKPKEKRTVGCKWIYNVKKCKFDGTLYRYRER